MPHSAFLKAEETDIVVFLVIYDPGVPFNSDMSVRLPLVTKHYPPANHHAIRF